MISNVEVYGLAPLVVVALAIVVDLRTRRGYGLSILSLLLLVCTSLVAAFFTLLLQQFRQNPPPVHAFGAAMILGALLFLAFIIAAYCTLSLLVGALVVAGIAGQWRWLVGLVVAALVPVLVIGAPILYPNVTQSPTAELLGIIFQPGLSALFVIPQATVLAYSIMRLVRPGGRARQPAPLA